MSERRRRIRARIAANRSVDLAYRITIAVVGILVLAVGILAIPYPGPGWLIVFAGLGILASEFTWANRLLKFVRKHYDRFMEWFGRQSIVVKGLGILLTTLVVLATLWLLGALALVAGWVGLDWSWLASPL
ncbi:MAG: TIGR02611 family protein [Rhodococcus sp. (in: high G+C Gram-positive bacteria)]